MLKDIEFYISPDGKVNINQIGQPSKLLEASDRKIVEEVLLNIRDLYPKAYETLLELYADSQLNKGYYEYKIVHRFIRCNFGEYDGLTFDIDGIGSFNFEHVRCPLRGECQHEGIICRPQMKNELSERENEVVSLLLQGFDKYQIAEKMKISPYTVTRHLSNIRQRLGLNSTNQIFTHFIKNGKQI